MLITVAILFVLNLAALFWAMLRSPLGCERSGSGFTDCRRCDKRDACRSAHESLDRPL